ncbi:MAG: DUF4405 domain-containing protein [Selenomonadaceae bacterium]|nr:DUF4405 domain-containing protein [Selenomonadaceae bacterium]
MIRLVIDALLIALFVAELSFNYLPKELHEIIGVALIVIIFVHFAINLRRLFALFNKLSTRKFFSIEVNLALMIGTLIILLTGLCQSNYLCPDLANATLRRNMTLHNLHTSTPYIMTILIGMHIGLHWREVKQKVLRLLGAEDFFKRRKRVFEVLILVMAAFGVLGLILNRFFDRIMMKHIFSTPATDLPAPIFIFLLVSSITFFAVITYFVAKKVFKE